MDERGVADDVLDLRDSVYCFGIADFVQVVFGRFYELAHKTQMRMAAKCEWEIVSFAVLAPVFIVLARINLSDLVIPLHFDSSFVTLNETWINSSISSRIREAEENHGEYYV